MPPVTRRYLTLIAVVILALAGWYAFWNRQITRFEREITAWGQPGAHPFRLTYRTAEFSGFPYRLEAKLEGARLIRSRPDYDVSLNTDRLTLVAQPWRQTLLLAFADAPVIAATGPAPPGSSQPVVRLTAPTFQASLHLGDAARIARLSIVLPDGRLMAPAFGLVDLRARELQLHLRERSDPPPAGANPDRPALWDILLRLRGAGLGKPADALVALPLTVRGDRGHDDGLTDWALNGGTVDIEGFDLTAGKVRAKGDATLALDRSLAIQAAGTVSTNDPAAIAAFLQSATLAPSRLKERDRVLPLMVQDGALTLAGERLRPVPPLEPLR